MKCYVGWGASEAARRQGRVGVCNQPASEVQLWTLILVSYEFVRLVCLVSGGAVFFKDNIVVYLLFFHLSLSSD